MNVLKKLLVFFLLFAVLGGRAAEHFRFFNIVPYSYGSEAEMARRMKSYREKTGNRDVLYCLSMHPEGVPAIAKIEQQMESFCRFRDALAGEDIRVGILVQSILGHWPRVDKEIEPWQRSIDVKGKPVRFCVLDSRFQQYICEVGRKLAQGKPAFIMSDDDVRSMCPEIECFCPLHVAEYNRRCGTEYTEAELRKIVSDGRMGEPLYDAFMKLSNEIPVTVVALLRKGINAVDSSIPTASCMAGRGGGMLETCRVMCGNGPMMLRITNQMYMETTPRDSFAAVILRTMGQRAQYQEIPYVLDEADTWPHTLYSRSAIGLHAKLVSSIFCGLSGAKLWFVDAVKGGVPVSPRYSDILGKHQAFYQELARVVAETVPDGMRIPCFRRPYALQAVKFPNEQQYPLSSWVDSQFGFFGIPFWGDADYETDGFYALGGRETIDRLNDGELRQILSHKVLVDGTAATALTARGFSEYLGCSAVPRAFKSTFEQDENGRKYGNAKSADTPYIENVAKDAEVLTHLCFAPYWTAENPETVAPGVVLYRNSLGGKILTMSFSIHASGYRRLENSRKALLKFCLDRLSDSGRFPFMLDDDQPEVLLARRGKDGSALLAIFNIGLDELPEVRIRWGKTPARFEELLPDGIWRPVAVHYEGEDAVISRSLPLYGTLVLRQVP